MVVRLSQGGRGFARLSIMCGIAGVVGSAAHADTVRHMLAQQIHRGPDGSGIFSKNVSDCRTVVLGHRRLAILDLSDAAAQPMADSTGNYAITFNGEIYNYIEVREQLRSVGIVFRTSSDTEVLLEAYK